MKLELIFKNFYPSGVSRKARLLPDHCRPTSEKKVGVTEIV